MISSRNIGGYTIMSGRTDKNMWFVQIAIGAWTQELDQKNMRPDDRKEARSVTGSWTFDSKADADMYVAIKYAELERFVAVHAALRALGVAINNDEPKS